MLNEDFFVKRQISDPPFLLNDCDCLVLITPNPTSFQEKFYENFPVYFR